MATVIITKEIRQHVGSKVGELFKSRLDAANIDVALAHDAPELWGKVYDLVIPQYIRDMANDVKYSKWLNAGPPDVFTLKSEGRDVGTLDGVVHYPSVTLTALSDDTRYQTRNVWPVDPAILTFPNGKLVFSKAGYGRYNIDIDENLEYFQKYRDRIQAAVIARNVVQTEQTVAVDAAHNLLTQHNTLAPALRQWPGLWDLLSEEVKNRHRAPNASRSRKAVELDAATSETLDTITTTIVINKLDATRKD